VDVVTEIVIDRPRSEVAAFASDPDRATAWYRNIRSVEWRTPRPAEVGSRVAFVARFLGRTLAYEYEIRARTDDERLVMSTNDGPLAMETTYMWRDEPGGGTRMTLRNRGEAENLFSMVAAPILERAMRRANREDLARLKSILEAGPPVSSGQDAPHRWNDTR
jgi:hypothetical protein